MPVASVGHNRCLNNSMLPGLGYDLHKQIILIVLARPGFAEAPIPGIQVGMDQVLRARLLDSLARLGTGWK